MKKIIIISLLICLLLIVSCTNAPDSVETKPGETESTEENVIDEPEPVIEEELETTEEVDEELSEPEPVVEKDPNLIAHWEFEDNAQDSANNYDGTIKGNAVFKEGKIGKSLYFDGVDDYVDFSQDAIDKIGSLTNGTISFYFKFESMLDKQTVMPILYLGVDEKDPDNIFIIEIGHFNEQSYGSGPMLDPDNKKLYVTWIKNNQDPFLCYDSNINFEENKWYHFAVVVSDDGNTGYLNGVEMTNRHYNFGNSKDTSFLDDIPVKEKFMLGYGRSSYMVGPDFVYYKGYLDEFRIYDKPLSSIEIKEIIE